MEPHRSITTVWGRRLSCATVALASLVGAAVTAVLAAGPDANGAISRLPVPAGAITHVLIVELENESAGDTFGSATNEPYLVKDLEPLGTELANYYAIGHASLDNYIAQVSGQAPNLLTSSDCQAAGQSEYVNLTPGRLDPNHKKYPGQVDGQGCVMPARVQTIGAQLDATYPTTTGTNWRQYAEDMGNDPSRDHGTPDPMGGTDCAHPTQVHGNATDPTEDAQGPKAGDGQVRSAITDQYVDRHNPFIFFHSVIDHPASCAHDVVPLGRVAVGTRGSADRFTGHLVNDLAADATTPRFSFITPNVCNDGHDSTCAGPSIDGLSTGGFASSDAWLRHWMPLILHSPAYTGGRMLVVITYDESNSGDSSAGDHERPGPNSDNPGFSSFGSGDRQPPPGTLPGGGRVGALLLNPVWVRPGVVDMKGSYNHYSALRTFEDLLGITTGGADGHGHLGFAATAHDFGPDAFRSTPAGLPVPST